MRTAIIPFVLCTACSVPEHHYIAQRFRTVSDEIDSLQR